MRWRSSNGSCFMHCPKGLKKSNTLVFCPPRYKIENIELIRKLTGDESQEPTKPKNESVEEMMYRLTGIDIKACPNWGKCRLTRLYELLPVYFLTSSIDLRQPDLIITLHML